MRRPLVFALVIVLLAAAGWSAFWLYAARDIAARVAAWAAAQRAQGLTATYSGLVVAGFPFMWEVRIDSPHMTGAGPTQWDWQGETVVATLRPWAIRDVPVLFPGTHRIAAGAAFAETLSITAARPEGIVTLDADGRLERLALDLGDATISRPTARAPVTVRRLQFELRPHRTPQPTYRTEVLDVAVDARDAVLPDVPAGGLGPRIAQAHLNATVKGALPSAPLPAAVAAWRDSGGVVEAKRVALRWGPLDIDGDGTVTLDAENRPLGAFSVRIRGYGETLDALAGAGLVRPRDSAAVKVVLNMLARQTQSGERELSMPVTAQDGRLTVAGFPLMQVPPIRFE
ncbi:MAG TPA: DUF2125 domain-containing protein [Alphaproteobacteria bacterium]